MTGATIAQLIIAFGPSILALLPKIAATWQTTWTVAEVEEFCKTAKKTYDEYIAEAQARVTSPP